MGGYLTACTVLTTKDVCGGTVSPHTFSQLISAAQEKRGKSRASERGGWWYHGGRWERGRHKGFLIGKQTDTYALTPPFSPSDITSFQ